MEEICALRSKDAEIALPLLQEMENRYPDVGICLVFSGGGGFSLQGNPKDKTALANIRNVAAAFVYGHQVGAVSARK